MPDQNFTTIGHFNNMSKKPGYGEKRQLALALCVARFFSPACPALQREDFLCYFLFPVEKKVSK